MPILPHSLCFDSEDYGSAVACACFLRGLPVRREMHVLPAAWEEALTADCGDVLFGCSVRVGFPSGVWLRGKGRQSAEGKEGMTSAATSGFLLVL